MVVLKILSLRIVKKDVHSIISGKTETSLTHFQFNTCLSFSGEGSSNKYGLDSTSPYFPLDPTPSVKPRPPKET